MRRSQIWIRTHLNNWYSEGTVCLMCLIGTNLTCWMQCNLSLGLFENVYLLVFMFDFWNQRSVWLIMFGSVMYLYGSCVASFEMKLVITPGKAKCTYWVIGPICRGINFFCYNWKEIIKKLVFWFTCMLHFRISDGAYLYLLAWERIYFVWCVPNLISQ